ncbi:MAG: hypothetical protein ACXVEE_11720 [Polyangiales bacterium]
MTAFSQWIRRGTRVALIGAIAAACSLPIACSTPTKVTSEWSDPSRAQTPASKLVVLGLRLGPSQRRVVEDQLVSSLGEKGIAAVPAYRVFGEEVPDRESALSMLGGQGYDGVLVVRMRSVTETPVYVPGSSTGAVSGVEWTNAYWGDPNGGSVYDPGYIVWEKDVYFDSGLWDLRNGRRVWTATTKTENPSSSSDFAKSLSKKLIPRLEELRLVGAH